jgi:hypothetical protein
MAERSKLQRRLRKSHVTATVCEIASSCQHKMRRANTRRATKMKKALLTGVSALLLATGAAQAQQKEKWETDFRRCQIEKHGDDYEKVITPEDVPDIMRALKELKKCATFWQCTEDRANGKVKHCYENDRRWR